MAGFHARVGDRRKRDAAISIQQMLAIQDLLESEWEEVVEQDDEEAQHYVAKMATFFLIGYCCALMDTAFLHVGVPLQGRLKA